MIGVPAPGRGTIAVCIDRGTSGQQCSDVDTDAIEKRQRELRFVRDGLTNSQHTIEITAKTTPVVLDGFVAIQEPHA